MTPEERRARDRAYYQRTKERRRELNKKRYDADPSKFARHNRNSTLKRKYGIDLQTYERMFEEQRGKCFICEQPPQDNIDLAVDHNHVTGEVRSLLCGSCNMALGLFKDSSKLLDKAANYIRAKGGSD